MNLTHEFILAERARRRERLLSEKYCNPTPETKRHLPPPIDAIEEFARIKPDPPHITAARRAALEGIA